MLDAMMDLEVLDQTLLELRQHEILSMIKPIRCDDTLTIRKLNMI